MFNHPLTRRELLRKAAALGGKRQPAPPSSTMPPHPADAFYTPTGHFPRLLGRSIPAVDTDQWRLRISGLAESVYWTYSDLRALLAGEFSCTVMAAGSSPRFPLIGNALWRGIPLSIFLKLIHARPEATHMRFSAADGAVKTFALDALRHAWLVYNLNGKPLSPEQGYPLRLLVPGRYDDHLPRWIHAIELTDIPPSVPDILPEVTPITIVFTPRPTEMFTGTVTFTGAAYAGLQSITQVEVSVDDAPWMGVPFEPTARHSWTLWKAVWQPSLPGEYRLQARAAAADGTYSPLASVVFRVVQS
ncbi:MAG: molybdopterin-dependent oxidoreductase [Anaerolineae bacterium]|nr:molybdopterin-dependent oxidoreductase [Anaerolineae bacterium]